MYTLDDTIAAISTPYGYGGIGIVRLSGPEALTIVSRLFSPKDGSWSRRVEPNKLYYGHITDPQSGQVVDEVLVSYMRSPHSYTREDVVEVNAHGGPLPLSDIFGLCLQEGARPAREGEFTFRAFVNGRLDLAQAEAVLDVIQARTEASRRLAMDQLSGHLSQGVRSAREALLGLRAYIEASIDFPDEEIPEEEIGDTLATVTSRCEELLREAEKGIIYRQGARVAIVGRPNVGKSSLLNRLLRCDRAIVAPVPGTTRDTLEEALDLQGIPVTLVDTAGISNSADPLERLGIERSRRSLERADLALMMVDISTSLTAEDLQVAELIGDRPAILVLNKCDLPASDDGYDALLPCAPHIRVSALYGDGLDELEKALAAAILSADVVAADATATNPRHREALRRAVEALSAAQVTFQTGDMVLVAIDLAEALEALGDILGETAGDDLLEAIFGRFCIGK